MQARLALAMAGSAKPLLGGLVSGAGGRGRPRGPLCRSSRLAVTTKTVERTAEAIGADIERRQQQERKRAMQLELPILLVPRIPILYVEMDGTGVPVVGKDGEGRAGKQRRPAGAHPGSKTRLYFHAHDS